MRVTRFSREWVPSHLARVPVLSEIEKLVILLLDPSKEMATMPYATICPKCSYHWILNEASPRSWSCPECRTLMTGEAQQNTCACKHSYRDHETRHKVENSLSAMTLRGDLAIANAIEAMSMSAGLPDHAIGRCLQCACANYRRKASKTKAIS